MGKIMSILIMALLAWGIVFIILRIFGLIHWHLFWAVSPILLAVVIFIIMVIIAAALGLGVNQ